MLMNNSYTLFVAWVPHMNVTMSENIITGESQKTVLNQL